jgi:hypothetical protein
MVPHTATGGLPPRQVHVHVHIPWASAYFHVKQQYGNTVVYVVARFWNTSRYHDCWR